MLNNFRKLFAYNDWANFRALESLLSMNPPPPRALAIFAHIVAAEQLWHRRLRKESSRGFAVWPDWTVAQCAGELTETIERWGVFIPGLTMEVLGNTISYTNTKGETWQNTVSDVLTHVIVHSGYHRGQVAADVRASGGEPAYTDYIHAVRRGMVETAAKP